MWDENTYPFPNFKVKSLKFGIAKNVISPHTLHGKWLPTHAGIKVNPP